jgi:hypothetical protein
MHETWLSRVLNSSQFMGMKYTHYNQGVYIYIYIYNSIFWFKKFGEIFPFFPPLHTTKICLKKEKNKIKL